MKMVKSLLLGTAAGVVAVAGAQAADLPVKARPVEYVKICTLYGAGYYYIPGSDTCIKFGGYIQEDLGYNAVSGNIPTYTGTGGVQDRTASPLSTRVRARFGVDTRTQTQYGTLRTLAVVTWQNQNQTESFNLNRAFIQFAGFTFGRVESFSDTWSLTDSYNLAQEQTASDTSPNGINSIDYTWQLGNGATFTVGADERRTMALSNLSLNSALKVGSDPTDTHAGEVWPDAIANLRIDQAWGYWSVSGVAHDVNATYYTSTGAGVGALPGFACGGTAGLAITSCGHPSDAVGWAVNTGAEVKLPQFGPGDRAGFHLGYAQGASSYGAGTNVGKGGIDLFDGNGANFALGWVSDGVYTNGGSIQLTTSWSAQAAYDHHWNAMFNTTVFAGYAQYEYGGAASQEFSDAVGCTATGAVSGAVKNTAVTIAGPNCSPNWQFLEVGTRTNWTLAPGFYLAGQVQYNYVWGAFAGDTFTTATNAWVGARPAGTYNLGNEGIWTVLARVYRSFNLD